MPLKYNKSDLRKDPRVTERGEEVSTASFEETRETLRTSQGEFAFYQIHNLDRLGVANVDALPWSLKILLESALRQCDGFTITEEHVGLIANWSPETAGKVEVAFMPGRVILQDFTGVASAVDLAALRSAMQRMGGNPAKVNPRVPVDLVIDHSVQVDQFGSRFALHFNAEKEFERNQERYEFLKWSQNAFDHFRVVPPATGIVHQVNLEYLASGVLTARNGQGAVAFPDSVVGTDSHTTMINGLGVLGWGVGGIEAEAVMLGQPIFMNLPEVVGVRLTGQLPEGTTATDLVLTVTETLRATGVVGKFVEFFGPGLPLLSLPDRATLGNMAPEYGATMGFFPTDAETLRYMRLTGRAPSQVELVEVYTKAAGIFHTPETTDPTFTQVVEVDMSTIRPSVAGPKRPQDRIELDQLKSAWSSMLTADMGPRGLAVEPSHVEDTIPVRPDDEEESPYSLHHGDIVLAAITSCTNTSNPSVMIGAALLAKKAVERGLSTKPWVKTSLAPGSKVVTRYLEASGLLPYLEELNFFTVGYGCTTCIGNSGPLSPNIVQAVDEGDLVVSSVLSGNRNFEGRINPDVKANFLASPPLVVAFALAGTVNFDMEKDPLGKDKEGKNVFLRDLWPSQQEIRDTITKSLDVKLFSSEYGNVFTGNDAWNLIQSTDSEIYPWDAASTYVHEPPFFKDMSPEPAPMQSIRGAHVLAIMPDFTTTDHISPAGSIAPASPAAEYLMAQGISRSEWNTYGTRRGNHEVMLRGTFANVRVKNQMLDGKEGGYTVYVPAMEELNIYDAALKYQEHDTPLIVLAGKEYGTGSSRDWAAKGTQLLGVKAVIAESYERIHRSNLVGMGVLPLQFRPGESCNYLGLTGFETFDILGVNDEMTAGQLLQVRATAQNGAITEFWVDSRVDTPVEVEYYRHGGILHSVLRTFFSEEAEAAD